MKILIAIDHFRAGGAERVASVLINQLCKEHEVHVVIMEEGINYPLDFEHIKIHLVDYKKGNKLIKVWSKLNNLRKIVREVNADVVYSFANFMSIYVAASLTGNNRRKVRLISSERTDPTREPTGYIARLLRNWAYSQSDFLVCQTPWVADYFKKKIKSQCVVIPNPITPNLPVWQGQNSNIIMTACRLEGQKNLPMLLNAFIRLHALYPNYKLIIYGEGLLRPQLETFIIDNQLQDYVELPGFNKDIHQAMVHSYMYVSSSDYEGISNSMLEALGIGIPTICTDCPVGGARMFINSSENGLLVPVGDDKALFQAMKRIIKDREFAIKCSQRSQMINEQIKASKIVEQWVKLIK